MKIGDLVTRKSTVNASFGAGGIWIIIGSKDKMALKKYYIQNVATAAVLLYHYTNIQTMEIK